MNILPIIKSELQSIANIPTNIIQPNESFTPKLGVDWIRLSSSVGEPSQITIGRNRTLRYTGTVQIDVFTKLNTGTPTIVQDIINHFLTFDNRFLGTTQKYEISHAWAGNSIPEDNWNRNIIFLRYVALVA